MSCLFTILVLAATVSFGQGAIQFIEDLANAEVSEGLEIGAYVGTIEARDTNDPNAVFAYAIRDLPESSPPDAYGYLDVDGASGNVTIKANIDYEIFTTLTAQWFASSTRSSEVTLYIKNENDNAPEFQNEPYSAEVSEDASTGFNVTTVTATDDDTGDTITYSLSNTSANCEMETFGVDITSGEIKVASALDYASVVQYTVCVKAEDDGGLEDITTVVISIRDAQNQPPVFIGQPYDKTIQENTPVGESVLTVVANDGDLGVSPRNTINYNLIDDADGTFSVQPDGSIIVEKELDRETEPITQLYTLIVQAIEDDSSQPFEQINTNTSIYIRLSDVDDNIPQFNKEGPTTTTIPEHSPRGTQLDFGLEAFDLDSGESGRITISLEDDEGVFYLASDTILNSGVVDVRVDNSSALDFERISQISFQIRASDTPLMNRSSVITAVVNLTNINDNTPTFSQDQYNVALPENSSPGYFVIQLEASDADIDSSLIYELLGYRNEWFEIFSGYINVSTDARFNAEQVSVYFLTCVVSDGERVSTALLNVTVTDMNDEPPVFQSETYSVTIPEYNLNGLDDEGELQVLEVVATDADSYEMNRILTYSIESGNEEGKFDINSTNGVIFRKTSIDRETEAATYELLVMAIDSGSPSLNGITDVTITIEDVNDNDPLFLKAVYTAEVAENAAIGTEVTNVTAVDADIDSLPVLYTIEGASPFLVNQEGIITLGGTVDYEVQMMYNLTVTATDREDTSRLDSCQVLIKIVDVNDERPVFVTPSPSSLSVKESAAYCDSPLGSDDCTVLITLNASDPDTNADLSFFITTVTGYDENNRMVEGNFSIQFGVVSATGEVFVQTELDRETLQRFDVTVGVKDLNATGDNARYQTDSANLVITVLDVNDNCPVFTDQLPDNFTTPETNQVGMVISVAILADDIDAGNNGRVTYGLLDDADGLVRIDPTTGILSVNKAIDKEMNDSLTITFFAKDLGDPPLNTTVTRQIFITDVNDETPEFDVTLPSEASLSEDADNGTLVLSVHATDKDADSGELIYSISAGVGAEDFEIDSENGDITIQKELDREKQSVYTLTVVASDGTRQDNLEVTINVLDVNDNPPVFTKSFPESTVISETAEPGSSVAAIVATDIDEPGTNNSAVRYSMINLNQTEFFKINYETGVVSLNTTTTNTLIPGVFVLKVTAFDLGDPRLQTDPKDFSVIVTDYNDEAPFFVNPTMGSIVYVNESYTGYITTAEATDGDLGDNGVVTYEFNTNLGATDDYKYFTINNITGEINIEAETDRERNENYTLGIIGMNARSDPIRSSQVTFYVEVNDTNDNEPAYWGEGTGPNGPQEPPEPVQLEVQENLGGGTFVGPVPTAVDLDSKPSYTQIFYFIVEGTNEDYFHLDKISGNLTLLRQIDREVRPQFSLVIKADSDPEYVPEENTAYDPLSDGTLARVTVEVTDVNDSPPRFDAYRYTAGVLFSTPFGVEIITVNATDPDLESHAVVVYEILSQTSYGYDKDGNLVSTKVNVFGINSFGQVINSVIFQDSVDSYYIVELQATDSEISDFKDNATLSVYLMTETDQVSAIFADEPGNIRERQNEFKQLLEEIMEDVGGYEDVSVNIDSLDFELDGNSLPISNRTEMLLHVVDDIENIVISPAIVQKVIDDAYGYTEELLSYHLIEVEFKTKQVEADVLTALQTASFALAFVMFLILILLIVVFYLTVTSYRREIRAATIGLYGASEKKEAPAPGTNKFAENKNPIFNPKAADDKKPLSDEDEEGKEAKESLQPKEEEFQEVELSFDVEQNYEEIGEGPNKLLDNVLDDYEKQGHVNLGFNQEESHNQNLYTSNV